MPNIYDRTFLRKYLKATSLTICAKNFIMYAWEGFNYVSLAVSFSCTVNKDTVNEDTVVLKNKCS